VDWSMCFSRIHGRRYTWCRFRCIESCNERLLEQPTCEPRRDLELNKNCAGGRQEANSQTGTQENHRESMNQTVGNRNPGDERTSGVLRPES
jgi:hypothetical protein